MTSEAIIEQLLTLATKLEPDMFGEGMISVTHETLFLEAEECFGGWDTALAHALKEALLRLAAAQQSKRSRKPSSADEKATTVALSRSPHPDAQRPLFVATSTGFLLTLSASALTSSALIPVAPAPLAGWSSDFGIPQRFNDHGETNAMVAVTAGGHARGWDTQIVPDASRGEHARNLSLGAGVKRWAWLIDRLKMRSRHVDRILCVTRNAQVKVSLKEVFPKIIDSSGVDVLELREGDALLSMHFASKDDELMMFNSMGYGIRFALSEIRPMGLKTGGIRGMQLRSGHVIASFLVAEAPQVAVITESGMGKRIALEDFRSQSRAGLGLIALKVDADDPLAAATPCSEANDVLLLTNHGRALRLPAEAFPLASRAAKAKPLLKLAEEEVVVGLTSLLPMDLSPPVEKS